MPNRQKNASVIFEIVVYILNSYVEQVQTVLLRGLKWQIYVSLSFK